MKIKSEKVKKVIRSIRQQGLPYSGPIRAYIIMSTFNKQEHREYLNFIKQLKGTY